MSDIELQKIVMLTQLELEALTEVLSHIKLSHRNQFDVLYTGYKKLVAARNAGAEDSASPQSTNNT